MSCSIGEFHKVQYQPMLNKFAYHNMLLCLLEKQECKNIRNEIVLADMNIVMTERDYTEALKAEFDIEIKSEAFGFNHNISI